MKNLKFKLKKKVSKAKRDLEGGLEWGYRDNHENPGPSRRGGLWAEGGASARLW